MPKKKKGPKKPKNEYDENGRWVQERNRIKGAMRRAFRLSPQMKDALNNARVELPPDLKKDGTPGKKNKVRFKCAICGKLFPYKKGKTTLVQVDHIETVVPLWKKEVDMTYDELAIGIFCPCDNLQVLCSTPLRHNDGRPSCHKKKTDEEKYIRKKFNDLEHLELHQINSYIQEWKEEYKEMVENKEKIKNNKK